MQKLSIAIVGFGNIGKKHYNILQNRQDICVLAIADEIFALNKPKNLKTVALFSSIDDLIKETLHLDAVCICTPSFLHSAQTIKCLKAGYHVFCEKPLALKQQDVESIILQSNSSNRYIFPVLQLRLTQNAKWLKNIINQNLLGKINMVQVCCFWNRAEKYYNKANWRADKIKSGGPLFTQFSHYVDLLIWLFGEPKEIKADFAKFYTITDFEDTGFITCKFEHNKHNLHVGFSYTTAVWEKSMESYITIIGENGTIKISGQYLENIDYIHSLNNIDPSANYQTGDKDLHGLFYDEAIMQLNSKIYPKTILEDSLKTIRFINQVYACGQ